ncbi:MAG TPA: phosphoenolpyruvate--protein phosphotransferase [Candidatus Latescibacteria bacterium]|jgi:phosphotransferase system enzyme I (PtsI)|nr:phosphoenolpyruvate--protein phosphotransferase [Candidatus Latescibacterota bacterium]
MGSANGLNREMTELRGISASPGIAMGPIYIHDPGDFWIDYGQIDAQQVDAEVARFERAIQEVSDDLQAVRGQVEEKLGKEHAQIFDAHLLMVGDQSLTQPTIDRIRTYRYHAEYAYRVTVREVERRFDAIQDAYFRSRKSDIQEVEKRVMGKLCQRDESFLDELTYDAIVVAENVQAADMVQIRSRHVLAICTEVGGRTSHTAIIARGLQIPAVVGVRDVLDAFLGGDTAIVDGTRGRVIINPDEGTLASYREEAARIRESQEDLSCLVDLPSETQDGTPVTMMVNIELPAEIEQGLKTGAQGVGLFRTEYLYLSSVEHPTEEEQTQSYTELAKKAGPNPVVIRTLDLGGDKLPYIDRGGREMNPFLGWRAIRVSLANHDYFKAQLKAILRASNFGDVRIMFPMISQIEELHEALAVLDEAKEDLEKKGESYNVDCPVGAMIEVPAAAMIADQIAPHVDFLSIGTNDLIQYSVAVDRGNDKVAYLFDSFHPGVLRLIRMVVEAAHAQDLTVTVCGEMAGDRHSAVLLHGLGVDGLSMATPSLLSVKKAIRSITTAEAEAIAEEALKLESKDEIKSRLAKLLDEEAVRVE